MWQVWSAVLHVRWTHLCVPGPGLPGKELAQTGHIAGPVSRQQWLELQDQLEHGEQRFENLAALGCHCCYPQRRFLEAGEWRVFGLF